jgi:hypothetical protein
MPLGLDLETAFVDKGPGGAHVHTSRVSEGHSEQCCGYSDPQQRLREATGLNVEI